MSSLSRFALAAAAVVAVAVVGSSILVVPTGPVAGTASAAVPSRGASSRPSAGSSDGGDLLAPLGYTGGGTIVFSRTDPAVGSTTWRIRPDGTGETALRVGSGWGGTTSLPGLGCCAVLSPNGTQVAVGYEEVNPERVAGVSKAARILNLDGSHAADPIQDQTNLGLTIPSVCGGCVSISGINYVPRAWSADGSRIAVEAWGNEDSSRDGIEVAYVGFRLLWDTQVAGPHRDVPVAFSPDGTELLFVRLTDDRSGPLMVTSVNRSKGITTFGTPREVTSPGSLVSDAFGPPASWSADGEQIVFAAGGPGDPSIYVAAISGGAATRIAGPGAYGTSVQWSPDGAWIAFDHAIGDPGGPYELLIARPDGSELTNLAVGFDGKLCCARWSPDSRALLVVGRRGSIGDHLLIVPIDGSPIAQVTRTESIYSDYSWGAGSLP